MTHEPDLAFETRAARAGIRVRLGDTISTMPPIDPSTTFTAESVDKIHAALTSSPRGFAYARNANPTVVGLEQAMADLEGTEDAVAFGSGMAAIAGVFDSMMLEAGDRIVAARALYGVTRTALDKLAHVGVESNYVDVADFRAVEEALSAEDVRFLYLETIANPLLQVADVARLVEIARSKRVLVVIDNTFASPYLLRPIELGVDIVLESATKYVSGHGDVTAGVVAGSRSWMKRIRDSRIVAGGVLSPFEAWLTLRGLRTLPIRMERQCRSSSEVAGWLEKQPWVDRVYHPGLASHPQHELAATQFGGRFGGMVAFDICGQQEEALRFVDSLELITSATSLGDVTSLVLYPPLSSHRGLTRPALEAMGIKQGLIRLSIGLESPDDLIRDLEGAADRCGLIVPVIAGTS